MLLWVSFILLLLVNPAYWLVISTWSPPKSLAFAKGFRLGSGLILERLGLLLLVCILLLPVSVVGLQLVQLLLFFLVGFSQIGGLLPIWLSGLCLIVVGGIPGLLNLFVVLLFGLLLGYLLLISLGVLSRLRFREFGRFMMSGFSLCLVVTLFCL